MASEAEQGFGKARTRGGVPSAGGMGKAEHKEGHRISWCCEHFGPHWWLSGMKG